MSAYTDAVLADSPIAYWRLSSTSGTEADLGTGGHTLTYNGAVDRGVVGLLNSDPDRAARFSATTTYCSTPNVADLRFTTGPWVVEVWVIQTGFTGWQRWVSSGQGGGLGYYLGITDTGTLVLTIPGVADIETTAIVNKGRHHIVAVFQADADVSFYVDGALLQTVVNATVPGSSATNPLRIGVNNGDAETFIGTIDEVVLYAADLSATRILAHYNAGIARMWRPDFSTFPKTKLRRVAA